jgi:hypothetical protein
MQNSCPRKAAVSITRASRGFLVKQALTQAIFLLGLPFLMSKLKIT